MELTRAFPLSSKPYKLGDSGNYSSSPSRRMWRRYTGIIMSPSSWKYAGFGSVVLLTCVFILFGPNSHILHNQVENDTFPQNSFEREMKPDRNPSPDPARKYFKRIKDVSSLHAKFTHLTRDSCQNTCEPSHTHCQAKTHSQWLEIFQNGTLEGVPLYSQKEYFFPWELQYLETPPLADINSLPSLNLSKVYFLPERTNQSSEHRNGVIVLAKNIPATFRVDLVDGYGRRRDIGGDEVRAWLKGRMDGPSPELVWATAKVKDLGNGSYDVIATPTWTGKAQLNVAVAYPREYIRAAVHHFRIGIHRFIFGMFKRKEIEEVTLCHSTPNVPGRHCVCNMTYINSLPYYCGRPLDTRLSCADWVQVNTVPKPGYIDMTLAETLMDKNISRHPKESLIRKFIPIQIKEGNKKVSLPPCRHADRRKSWTMTSPRGMWTKSRTQWNSLVCEEPEITPEWIHNCLKSTKVWMIGDSNIRYMAVSLSGYIGCPESQLNSWPSISFCRNEDYNITVQFRPHEYPLYVANRWLGLLDNGPVIDTISSIPSTGDHILLIHYYLHFSSSHLNVLLQRLRTLKTAISSLLSRNPKVLIGIRGPHTSALEWKENHMFGGDVLGTFIRQMYLDIFRGLRDSVVFLDGWDMSISFENDYFHPYQSFNKAVWRTFLAYKCN